MKLMTKEIEKKLMEKPLYSTEGEGLNAECIVKYFNPYGLGTWLISEGSKTENGDWELFGLCCITDWEFGSVYLSDLESIEFPWGSGIERDRYAHGTIGELAAELGYYSYDDYEVEDEPTYNAEEEER